MSGTHAGTDSPPGTMPIADPAFVRADLVPAREAPTSSRGAIGWVRAHLVSSWLNAILTVLSLYLVWLIIPPVITFLFIDAVWVGDGRDACATVNQGGVQPNGWFGACWPYVAAYFDQFVYGRYPFDERWRVNLTGALFVAGLVPALMPNLPGRGIAAIYLVAGFPVIAFILLSGGQLEYDGFLGAGDGPGAFFVGYLVLSAAIIALAAAWTRATGGETMRTAIAVGAGMLLLGIVLIILGIDFGLRHVETARWGGLLVTLVIAVTGIAASLPLGILLALGRRSHMPAIRLLSVIFIEFWRGVPLITVLFMSSVMLPLFAPEGTSFDKLLRALIGVALFASAYMAENVRGGLQAIPKGQYEGAMALGLTYWQMMRKIVLPQALKLVIPGIVNTFISLFKDTTLVLIIGLFDFLGMIQSSFTDPKWASPVQVLTAYAFAAFVYWLFCFGMSRYSLYTERRLTTDYER